MFHLTGNRSHCINAHVITDFSYFRVEFPCDTPNWAGDCECDKFHQPLYNSDMLQNSENISWSHQFFAFHHFSTTGYTSCKWPNTVKPKANAWKKKIVNVDKCSFQVIHIYLVEVIWVVMLLIQRNWIKIQWCTIVHVNDANKKLDWTTDDIKQMTEKDLCLCKLNK